MTAIRSLAFGELLKHYRIAARLTQEELATRSGLSVRGISALERGVNRAPRKDTLALLLRALDLSTRERSTLELAARQHNHLHAVSPHASVAPSFALGDPTPSPRPLVGRTRELLALERHLAGQFPPVLLLAGEPGIGKTRLMQETGVRALTQGLQVLRGGCHKRDGQDSYEPLLGALEAYVRSQPPAQLHANLEGCARLVRLMPELVEMGYLSAPEWTLAPEQERRLMFRSVQQFLSNIAEPAGILLLLDDLQWAGTDALDLLAALAESGNAARLRVVAAYRTTDVHSHDPLSTTLAELVRNGLATQIELGPLTPHESEELLWELLRDHEARTNELVARILRRAGGVPFFLVSCASGLQRSTSSADTAVDLPWTVAQSIRQRVAALPVLAQALLNAAAVAGRQAPQTMLVAIGAQLGHDKLAVLGALDVACRARLLMEDGTNSYQFPHDLVREALEADLTAPHRTALHQQVAEALKQGEGEQPAALLAYHFGCAGDDRQAAFYLQQAGDHALAIQAHAAAETYFRELINRLERLGRSAQVAQAREQLGVVLTNLARYDQALDLLDRAAEAYRVANDLEGWARTTAEIGSVHALRGTAVEGVARLRPLLEVLTTSEVSVRNLANLYVTHAWLVNENARYDEALAGAERAAKLARDARDSALLTQAELRRGQALLMLGHLQDGMQVLQQAIPLAEISGDLRSLRFALNSLSWIYELWGEFELDRQYTERAFAVAERLGDPSVIAFMLCNRGGPAFNLGQWDQARTDY